jgi:hypothetical protein
MKRKEEQLDLFGSEPKSKRKAPEPALRPRRAERTARHTTELFDDFELLPTAKR